MKDNSSNKNINNNSQGDDKHERALDKSQKD